MGARRRGSVRFKPYVKIQWYDERSVCWRDVQIAFPSTRAARAQAAWRSPEGARWRLVEVSMAGRRVLEEMVA